MGLLFIDGFDHELNGTDLTTKWSGCNNTGAFAIDSTEHAFTGSSLKMSNVGGNVGLFKSFPALGRVIVGCAVNPNQMNISFCAPAVPTGFTNTIVLCAANGANGRFDIYSVFPTLIGSTPNGSFPLNTWTYFEADIIFSLTNATITIKANGVQVAQFTGVALNSATCQSLMVLNDTNNADWIDDLYILDPSSGPYANPIGPARIQTLTPTANDAVQWTPNGAAQNFNNVNAIPFSGGATDFNSNIDTNTGFQDTFGIQPLFSNPTEIFAVAVTSAFSESVATGDNVSNVLKSGATTVAGTSFALATTYAYKQDIFVDDPHTAAPWTIGGVNAAKIGYKQD